jgi:DNA-binding MarR family transcriptional regulator
MEKSLLAILDSAPEVRALFPRLMGYSMSRGEAGGVGRKRPEIMVRRPGFLVRRLHQIFVSIYFQTCGRFGTTPVQSSIMQVLNTQPGIDQAALAAEIGLDRTTTSNVLSRLEARRIVRREVHPDDRRTKRAFLTSQGKTLLLGMQDAIEEAHGQLMGPLNRDERKLFLSLLLRLVEENNDKGRSALSWF